MTQGGTGTQQSASGDVLAMTSLASRQDLPVRVRQLLDGVLGLFWRNLERSLATALDEFERYLIQQANKPRVDEAGGRCLESIRRIKPMRADLAPRFMLSLEDDLARFDRRAAPVLSKKAEPAPAALLELSLVGSSELDESLTLREMASRVEARHSVPLYELGYRFGVLAAHPAFDVESLPLGPGRITAALRYAVAVLDLPLDHRILFYQTFDRLTMSGLGALYTSVNTYLAEQRILKYLQLQTVGKSRSAAEARPAAPAARASFTPPRPRGGDAAEVDVGGFGLAVFEVASTKARPHAPISPADALREQRPQRVRPTIRARGQFGLAARAIKRTPPQPGHDVAAAHGRRLRVRRARIAGGARCAAGSVRRRPSCSAARSYNARLRNCARICSTSCVMRRRPDRRRDSAMRMPTPSIWSACSTNSSCRRRAPTAARSR
jgi:hypothetical protein